MTGDGRERVVIEGIEPEIDSGRFPIKRIPGEKVLVRANVFADGHDSVSTMIMYRMSGEATWKEASMRFLDNDIWEGEFTPDTVGNWFYTVVGWIDHFMTWQKDIKKKQDAKQDIRVDLLICAELVNAASKAASGEDRKKLEKLSDLLQQDSQEDEAVLLALSPEYSLLMDKYGERLFPSMYERELPLVVDRPKALFSAWYECFPRSLLSKHGDHGTFRDLKEALPDIKSMGFDILYLPPLHPIGKTRRKGKNNSSISGPGDVGSPWAIGSDEGGHTDILPLLGTIDDFENLVTKAAGHGVEIAVDIAFQCSPDHPYVKKHPEWFKWRPDGTVQYAENPPKKYQDIIPLNFETERWKELWEELRDVVLFWIRKGIRIFRIDNPHTKPFCFWEWLITDIKKNYPDTIFLAEAFTRPNVMYRLAKLGFTQSYTYFTWRNTKKEIIDYLTELTRSNHREYFRPNFWPNTPDILPEHLQFGGRSMFMIRAALAATLSSNYGIYGPAFELLINEAVPGKEEYLNSEKYEIKKWDWDAKGNIKDFIGKLNAIRRENPALHTTWNIKFYDIDNDYLLCFEKASEDLSNIIIVVINLNPDHKQSGWINVPIADLGIGADHSYMVHDLLTDKEYIWQEAKNFVEIDPQILPAHIFRVRKKLKREHDFDYYL
jgi:starch synthase (maltosyl-transferring)